MQQNRPILITGSQRSGTTLLNLILDSHSSITGVDEMDLDGKHLSSYLSDPKYAPQVCFKLPAEAHQVQQIPKVLPGVRVLWSLRHPLDVVASMVQLQLSTGTRQKLPWALHLNGGRREIENCWKLLQATASEDLRQWVASYFQQTIPSKNRAVVAAALCWRLKQELIPFYEKAAIPFHIVRYESLTTQSRDALVKMLLFLRLPWEEALLQHHRLHEGVSVGNTVNSRAIDAQSVGKWKQVLSEEEASLVQAICEKTALELGYIFPHLAASHPSNDGSQSTSKLPMEQQKEAVISNLLSRGKQLIQSQQFRAAFEVYQQVLRQNPEHSTALYSMGWLFQKAKKPEEAIQYFQQVLQGDAQHSPARYQLAKCFFEKKAWAAAEQTLQALLKIQPTHRGGLNLLGKVFVEQKRVKAAKKCFEKLVQVHPEEAGGYYNLGCAALLLEDTSVAIASFRQVLKLQANFTAAYVELAQLYFRQNQRSEAEKVLKEGIRSAPRHPMLYKLFAHCLRQSGQFEQGIQAYQKVIELEGNSEENLVHLAHCQFNAGYQEDSLNTVKKAEQLYPDSIAILATIGSYLIRKKEYSTAKKYLQKVQAIDPEHLVSVYELPYLKLVTCDWFDWENCLSNWKQAVEQDIQEQESKRQIPLLWLNYAPFSPDLIQKANQAHAQKLLSKRPPKSSLLKRPLAKNAKIKIGYLSPDFRQHVMGRMVYDLFQHHNREQFEVFAYALIQEPTEGFIRQAIRKGCDHFLDCQQLSNTQIAQQIHQDGIDILIDLGGYTTHARPEIVAQKPAPIQIQYLGYPCTMGASFMPYVIADPWLIPKELAHFYTEEVLYLEHAFVSAPLPKLSKKLRRTNYHLPKDAFVFSCLNTVAKIEPTIFQSWMNILKAVPNGVLWLLEESAIQVTNLRKAAQHAGIAPHRLIFLSRKPYEEYLACHALADLFLDTLYYSAGATAVAAIHAGVPVLTCVSNTYTSRMAASVNAAAGMEALICENLTVYEQKAIQLARIPSLLSECREALEIPLSSLPLFDRVKMVRNLERHFWACFIFSLTHLKVKM